MGRKTISAKQRSIPVSFSVKPALADRIEDMAYDQRFTRSKFLQEAVLRYINFIEMGGLESSENISDMVVGRRVLIGANALQEANRENQPVPENVIAFLNKQLEVYELKTVVRRVDAKESKPKAAPVDDADITFEKVPNQSEYQIFNHGTQIGIIVKDNDFKAWITSIGNDRDSHRTLKHAKETVMEAWS